MPGNKNKHVLVSGCSFTMGHGLNREIENPNLWVNLVFDQCVTKNIALAGRNNHSIFVNTVSELMNFQYDLVIVAWSIIPRINVNIGLELYETLSRLVSDYDINTNERNYNKEYLGKLGDRIRDLFNDHWDFVNLIAYVNSLIKIQESQKTQSQIFFVNTYSPWPTDFFEHKTIQKPSDLPEYTQDLLNVNNRDDKEILGLYDMIHQHYANTGGINEDYWLNLNHPFSSMHVDSASPTDNHPGVESQNLFANHLTPILKEKLNTKNIRYLRR